MNALPDALFWCSGNVEYGYIRVDLQDPPEAKKICSYPRACLFAGSTGTRIPSQSQR